MASCITFNPCCTKRQKTAFFDMNFIKIAQNHSFTKMSMKISYMYTSCIIWQYYLCVMYIHWHTIGFIGVTELGTVTFHLAPNRRPFHLSISRWIWLRQKISRSSLSLFVPSFITFQPLTDIVSPSWWEFLTEIGPWPRMHINVPSWGETTGYRLTPSEKDVCPTCCCTDNAVRGDWRRHAAYVMSL